jgi:PPM family protein phosphatase
LRGGGPDNITVIIADVTDADIVEETPVVGGAAANDRGMVSSADASTPAARASALTQPREPVPPDPQADDDADRPKRHPIRIAIMLIVLVGLLGGGLWGGWRYTQSKYYVGVTDDGTIAVFQGIPGKIAGFDLSTVDYLSSTKIADLTPVAQERVKKGIQAVSEAEARNQLEQLVDPSGSNVLPFCPTPAPAAADPTPPPTDPVSGLPVDPITASPTTPEPPAPTGPPDCRPGVR